LRFSRRIDSCDVAVARDLLLRILSQSRVAQAPPSDDDVEPAAPPRCALGR